MKMIALLRGINVGGNRKIPMPELRATATRAGFTEVRSYIASGNLVFEAGTMTGPQAAKVLELAIERTFGFKVKVIVRTAAQWKKYAAGSPFPLAERERPNLLLLGLCEKPLKKSLFVDLGERAIQGEKIKLAGEAIWVDFVKSVGNSKLTPAFFDKIAGSPVTLRNWNTVLKLKEMLDEK